MMAPQPSRWEVPQPGREQDWSRLEIKMSRQSADISELRDSIRTLKHEVELLSRRLEAVKDQAERGVMWLSGLIMGVMLVVFGVVVGLTRASAQIPGRPELFVFLIAVVWMAWNTYYTLKR